MPKLRDWFDDRTGYRTTLSNRQARSVPGGPSWGRTLGPCALMLATVEVITGLILMARFAPSTTSAWASIHFNDQIAWGGFLRGFHYWAGQTLIVILALYMLRALLVASFRAPRELAWVTGLLLLPLVVVWTLSGGLIMGTQTARGQIEVETNIVAALPWIGPSLQELILGGSQIGHLANTHLYAIHVALLPIVVGLLTFVHVWQIRRNGVVTPENRASGSGDEAADLPYLPYQSIRNWLVFVIVLAGVGHAAWHWAPPLDMPADPEFEHIARPEWYFAFLFQLRHYFTGPQEVMWTMAVPGAMLLLLVFLPLFDRWLPRSLGVVVPCSPGCCLHRRLGDANVHRLCRPTDRRMRTSLPREDSKPNGPRGHGSWRTISTSPQKARSGRCDETPRRKVRDCSPNIVQVATRFSVLKGPMRPATSMRKIHPRPTCLDLPLENGWLAFSIRNKLAAITILGRRRSPKVRWSSGCKRTLLKCGLTWTKRNWPSFRPRSRTPCLPCRQRLRCFLKKRSMNKTPIESNEAARRSKIRLDVPNATSSMMTAKSGPRPI